MYKNSSKYNYGTKPKNSYYQNLVLVIYFDLFYSHEHKAYFINYIWRVELSSDKGANQQSSNTYRTHLPKKFERCGIF